MEILKKIFPLSFKFTSDVTHFVIGIIFYVVAGIIFSLLATLANFIVGWIPVVSDIVALVLSIAGTLVGVYSLAGLVILILVYCKVIKE